MQHNVHSFSHGDAIATMLDQMRLANWLPPAGEDSVFSSCLPALSVALSLQVSTETICHTLPRERAVLTEIELINCLSYLGMIGHKTRVTPNRIDERLFPCLFIPDEPTDEGSAAYVIMSRTMTDEGEKYVLFSTRREVLYTDSLPSGLRGHAYFFVSSDEVADAMSDDARAATGHSWFRALLSKFHQTLMQVCLLSMVIGIVSLAAPIFVMIVYDKVINTHATESLYPLLAGALLALATEATLRKVRMHSLIWFGTRLDHIVSTRIFEQLMLMPPLYTERAAIASQIARLKAFETVRDFFAGSPLFLAIVELPFTIILLGTIAVVAGKLAFIPLIMIGLYAALLLSVRSKLQSAIATTSKYSAQRHHMAMDTFDKMHGLRACGMGTVWFRRFRDVSGRASLAGFHSSHLATIVDTIAQAFYMTAGIATAIWGIFSIWDGTMSAGALIATMIFVWRVLSPLQIICNSIPRLEQLRNAIVQVNKLMTIGNERDHHQGRYQPQTLSGNVNFRRVGLRYTKEMEPVFAGLSFNATQGSMIAITGANGVGKSSILKLVNGLYKPQSGSIRIDGMDSRQINPISLRRLIAYVPQTPHFFHGTIADNLRLSDTLASDFQLKNALCEVGVWDDICAMPNGLHTVIDGRHHGLSDAMLYRLSLARAYVRNSAILLLDELPYSVLEGESAGDIIRSLKTRKGAQTIFMVTHTPTLLELADTAIYLRAGAMPVIGAPDDVIRAQHHDEQGVYV